MEENDNKKILIVDDEPDITDFIGYNLRKEGFRVVVANDGAAGIEAAKTNIPDLILLDIMMPEMDGVEVCRTLRQLPQFNQTVIAFLTARSEDYTHIAALDAGGDDFITKPITPRVLLSRINAMLRRNTMIVAADSGEPVIDFGELRIIKSEVMVYLKEVAIALARKEFEILVLLSSKPGKVFTREEIFTKIWGNDVIVGIRTIDVHIRKLRERVGEDYIQTVKGIGYKFVF